MKTMIMLGALLCLTSVGALAAPKKIRVLLWSEQTEPRNIYPTGISGALAEHLSKMSNMETRTATLTDQGAGVSDAALEQTDVLVWFGHKKHNQVPDDAVDRIVKHVRERGMGFIALHSSHYAKPLKKLLNATGSWSSYVNAAKPERIWVVSPAHPIAKGVKDFTIPQEEIYTEPYEVPEPESVIAEGTWESGHRNREVMTWTLDKGRMVYIRAGHEDYPIFLMPQMQKIIANSVEWSAGRTKTPQKTVRREAGPAATVRGPYKKESR